MLSPQFLGAFTKWILKGCKTNLLKDELNDENPWSNKKDNENFVIGIIVALLLTGLGIFLVKHKVLPLDF